MKSINGLGNRERFSARFARSRSYILGHKNYKIPIILFVQSLTDRPNNRFTREHEYDRNCAQFS